MIDKQIINVIDCNYHNNGKCTNSAIGQCNCANVASCYYKEYKRKEQECEELKETFDGLFKVQYKLADNNKQLRQTLAEIKEIAESEMDSKEFMAVQCMLNGSVDNKNKVLKQIIQKINEVENV